MPLGYEHPNSWLREDDEFDGYNKPGSPDWFSLSDDVSFAKANNRHDAIKVESLLGYGGYLDHDKGGGPLGLSNLKLEQPIKAFQAKNGLKVDGLMRPGGPTIRKMKDLYGNAFAGTPAPTPAMMDAHVERKDAGEEGFLWDSTPAPLPKPNRRLDGKAHLMEYERWNRDWARNARDSASFAPEYESYIRQIEPAHGNDPGLIFARDFTKQVEELHGTGGQFAKALLARLSDRPDLQREYLSGAVPQSPPVGTFKPGGEEAVKEWIDDDRIANGIKPRYRPIAGAFDTPPVLRANADAPATPAEPDPSNLLEYGANYGLPEDWALAQQPPHAPDQPNPRPTASPPELGTDTRQDGRTEPPSAPTLGELDPNQMAPVPKPPVADAPAKPPERPQRPASRPDPKTLPSDQLEVRLRNAQSELDMRTKSLNEAAQALEQASQARQTKEAERGQGIVVNAIKGAISGVASAEIRRKTLPHELRPVGRQRIGDMGRGGAKGSVGAMTPDSVHMTSDLAALRADEQAALEEQNRRLEAVREWLEWRDELLNEREARRRIRPDQ